MDRQSDCLIIGGGVIGVACAYYLNRAGRKVRVLEKGSIGCGSSYGNCGLVSPSHALPLAQPGIILKSLKWMLHKDSPLYIRPALNLSLFSWLLKFAGRCNHRDVIEAMNARADLLKSSRDLFDDLLASEPMDVDWEAKGALFVYRDPKEFEGFSAVNELMKPLGLEATPFTGKQLVEKEPALRDDLSGAWYYVQDAHLRPNRLMEQWGRVIVERGVVVEEGVEVQGFEQEGPTITAVNTSEGDYTANQIVVATGAWSPKLCTELGISIPIQPGKGYSITMKRPSICPRIPCLMHERKVLATPWNSGYRLGGTMEFSGYDARINRVRIEAIRRAAPEYLRESEGEIFEDYYWFGWRPMTYDDLPIIDRSPKHDNLVIAAGHNMLGVSMAPATGLLVAQLCTGQEPHIDLTPYSATRF